MTDRPQLTAALVQLRRRVDDHFAAARARSPDAFACRAGCDRCCHQRLSVFAVEADAVRQGLRRLAREAPELRAQVRAQAQAADERCVFLVSGACAIYDERPLICRSHGLPVAVPGPGPELQMDVCPLNFQDGPPPRASVLNLDALNQPLAVMAMLWDRAGGGDLPSERVPLAALALAPDPL